MENEKVFLVIYVDDGLVICKNKQIIIGILNQLKTMFQITFSEPYYFVGLEILKTDTGISISQTNYIHQIIQRFNMSDASPVSIPEDPNQNLTVNCGPVLEENDVPYRQAIGSLMFLATVSRPDISHAVGVLSRYVNRHSEIHWTAIKRIIKYLIGTSTFGILFQKGEQHSLIGFSDADFAGDFETRKSTSGYVYKYSNAPITWTSRRQQSVSVSTTEAEYIAASEACKEAIWLTQLLSDLDERCNRPVELYLDNQSAIRLIKNPEMHTRAKHISVRYHFIRELYEKGDINVTYVNTNDQEADIFTKALHRDKFQKLRHFLGVRELQNVISV